MSSDTSAAPPVNGPQVTPQPPGVQQPSPAPGGNGASPGAPAPPRPDTSDHGLSVYVLVIGGLIIYLGAIACVPTHSWWISILFGIPVAAQVIGGAFHVKNHPKEDPYFYYFTMFLSYLCLVAYCGLWVWYARDWGGAQYLSYAALVIVTFLILSILFMMSAFMKKGPTNTDSKLYLIKNGAGQDPFWAIIFLFFVIFLDVTYLFGFAFAFHDRYSRQVSAGKAPALRMVNYDSSDDGDFARAAPGVVQAVQPRAGGQSKGVDADFYFYFVSGEAQLDFGALDDKCDLPTPRPTSADYRTQPPQRQAWLSRWRAKPELRVEPNKVESNRPFNQLFNRCSLERLKRRIEEETEGGRQVRLALVGQGDKYPIGKRDNRPNAPLQHYMSNYELSEARVQNVRYQIIGALKNEENAGAWHNLEWLTLPSSDEGRKDQVLEDIFPDLGCTAAEHDVLVDMNQRVVAVSIVPVKGDEISAQVRRDSNRKLELIDYMYFSIYTITTTGYGDIIPTTAYAKFIISIANICEVLFLVVFFNALVSIRKDNNPVTA